MDVSKGTKRKANLGLREKYEILMELEEGKKNCDIARDRNVTPQQISNLLKKKEEIVKIYETSWNVDSKSLKVSKYPEIDSDLAEFVDSFADNDAALSIDMIKAEARRLACLYQIQDFKVTDGYYRRFKFRHNLTTIKKSGDASGVSTSTVENWTTKQLPKLIEGYVLRDIYNIDETGLYWKQTPTKTIARDGTIFKFPKSRKDRVTLFLGANMDGSDKLRPLMIGRYKNPRGFKTAKLPFTYRNNSKAWMDSNIFR